VDAAVVVGMDAVRDGLTRADRAALPGRMGVDAPLPLSRALPLPLLVCDLVKLLLLACLATIRDAVALLGAPLRPLGWPILLGGGVLIGVAVPGEAVLLSLGVVPSARARTGPLLSRLGVRSLMLPVWCA